MTGNGRPAEAAVRTLDESEVSVPRLTPLERYLLSKVPAGQEIPLYGSPEFDACDDVTLRAASVIRAAAAWRDHCSPERIAADLRRQLADEDAATWARIRSTSADVCEARDWRAASLRPSFRELQERRAS